MISEKVVNIFGRKFQDQQLVGIVRSLLIISTFCIKGGVLCGQILGPIYTLVHLTESAKVQKIYGKRSFSGIERHTLLWGSGGIT